MVNKNRVRGISVTLSDHTLKNLHKIKKTQGYRTLADAYDGFLYDNGKYKFMDIDSILWAGTEKSWDGRDVRSIKPIVLRAQYLRDKQLAYNVQQQGIDLKINVGAERGMKLDVRYPFTKDNTNLTPNQEYSELLMAQKIYEYIKNWDKKYPLDLNEQKDGDVLKVLYYKSPVISGHFYSLKHLLLQGSKLVDKGEVSKEKYNSWLDKLSNNVL